MDKIVRPLGGEASARSLPFLRVPIGDTVPSR